MVKIMKKIFFATLIVIIITGCSTVNVASRIGENIGSSFQSSSARIVSASAAIKSWPTISGLIKGTLADNYNFEIPVVAQSIIKNLDDLAAKETLTDEDKGRVIGYFVRLEYIAASESWNKYGISVVEWIKAATGI